MASSTTSARTIALRNVRTHNLKSINLDLPLGRLIVVTGVSGAGKSSLAFDTIYAEGQRRYVETFSAYARQFLEPLSKPDADRIESIPPAIAVAARQSRPSGRSTVGTITEIHDYLSLLYARTGMVTCVRCGNPVIPATPTTVSRAVESLPEGTRYEIGYPLEILAGTNVDVLIRALLEAGMTRLRLEGRDVDLTSIQDRVCLEVGAAGVPDVIVDRLIRGRETPERRLDSIETAFARGLGRCRIHTGDQTWTHFCGWRCSRCETDHIEPQSNLFRPSSALGACPHCQGLGQVVDLDLGRIVPDRALSIREGAIAPWNIGARRGTLQDLIRRVSPLGIPVNVPFDELGSDQLRLLIEGDPDSSFPGLKALLDGPQETGTRRIDPVHQGTWRRRQECPACRGARLRPEALAVRIDQLSIAELSALTIREARSRVAQWRNAFGEVAVQILEQVQKRLDYLGRIGLDYLTLNRPGRSLSSGEIRRATMARTLGTGLVNTLFVLDEPTIGLHRHDEAALIEVMGGLRDAGNTLVVVEHERAILETADHIVDLGPGAGKAGGQVVYSGPREGFAEARASLTSDFLTGRKRVEIPRARRTPSRGFLTLNGARGHNLKDLDVAFPLGVLCVVAGVSGAGKSTLVEETLFPAIRNRLGRESVPAEPFGELIGSGEITEAVFLDQVSIGKSGRSNPVTYLKAFDEIRKTFAATHDAKLRNYDAGLFSFNVEGGRCSNCKGDGYLTVDMQFLADVMVRCPDCRGSRYRPEVLEITYRGLNIAEVLDLTAREAFVFFRHRPKIQARLRSLLEIGLDYLRLGQPAATLSGGEAQRLKLAGFLSGSMAALNRAAGSTHTLLILEEPTAGLHPFDILRLIDCLNSLVDRGNSVIVVEHSLELMVCADWIIDLGPGAGEEGGRIVAQGTPEEVARSGTITGRFLAEALERPDDRAS